MKKSAFIFLVLCLVMISARTLAADNKKALGSWNIQVAEAPVEYSASTMTAVETEGKLSVRIVFANGQSLTASTVSFVNDLLKFSVSIEGYDIPFNGKIAGNVLTGTVDTPDGIMSVKGEKITLSGSWDYNAPDAPYEYSTGKIIFDEKDGKPAGKIVLTGGYEISVSNLKTDSNTFSFSADIEGEVVKVSGKLVNGKITGTADYSEGQLGITAVRSKAKK